MIVFHNKTAYHVVMTLKKFVLSYLICLDRDKYITVNWENVNPQQYDFFAVSDLTKFSSYGEGFVYSGEEKLRTQYCPKFPIGDSRCNSVRTRVERHRH